MPKYNVEQFHSSLKDKTTSLFSRNSFKLKRSSSKKHKKLAQQSSLQMYSSNNEDAINQIHEDIDYNYNNYNNSPSRKNSANSNRTNSISGKSPYNSYNNIGTTHLPISGKNSMNLGKNHNNNHSSQDHLQHLQEAYYNSPHEIDHYQSISNNNHNHQKLSKTSSTPITDFNLISSNRAVNNNNNQKNVLQNTQSFGLPRGNSERIGGYGLSKGIVGNRRSFNNNSMFVGF